MKLDANLGVKIFCKNFWAKHNNAEWTKTKQLEPIICPFWCKTTKVCKSVNYISLMSKTKMCFGLHYQRNFSSAETWTAGLYLREKERQQLTGFKSALGNWRVTRVSTSAKSCLGEAAGYQFGLIWVVNSSLLDELLFNSVWVYHFIHVGLREGTSSEMVVGGFSSLWKKITICLLEEVIPAPWCHFLPSLTCKQTVKGTKKRNSSPGAHILSHPH